MKKNKNFWGYFTRLSLFVLVGILVTFPVWGQEQEEEYESITSEDCVSCHEKSEKDTDFAEDISKSIHDGIECLDCHSDKAAIPHKDKEGFVVGCQGCRQCHETESEQYDGHGKELIGECDDMPTCSDCHGTHDVLPSSDRLSKTHPLNLTVTCGICHKDLDLIEKYQIRTGHPVEVYNSSIHGTSVQGGELGAATCNDCHSRKGTAHQIYSAGNPQSSINHFNIPETCGKCHEESTREYKEGIHGQLAAEGDTESPVCTHCHGEHGIISPKDPRSPVSRARMAEATCEPCHESISLTERYGISTGRRTIFLDNYHGLKTQSGDLFVANCGSCHEYHLILPSSDPRSSIHPDNLQTTCGECHPGITEELASVPIHGVGEMAGEIKAVKIVRIIYIIAIIVIIGLMALHWIVDFVKQVTIVMRKPQVRRMLRSEVWQHTLLMVSFIVLVITGFSLRYGNSWYAKLLFGWDHGFEFRGISHRVAAVVLMISSFWHVLYLFTQRGKQFFRDMLPNISDLKHFIQRMMFNLGLSKTEPKFKRFSYVEKAEYWALIWGNIVMIVTGLLLWFDNYFVRILPDGILDVALVIHFYEAILASLAILIWHLYATVFNPHVYPMNPSWLTGKMPKDMFQHEHGDVNLEEVEDKVKKEKERHHLDYHGKSKK